MDKLIIGAGLYGLYAALYCGKRGQQVEVLEIEQAPFTRATYINQARVHMGYHYPRSLSTAMKSAGYFKRFVEDYSFCIHTKFEQIYATSSHFSWTDATEFRKFCQDAGIPCKTLPVEEYFQPGLCDGAFLTEEYTYDAHILRDYLMEEIAKYPGIKLHFGRKITEIEKQTDCYEVTALHEGKQEVYRAPFVLNATYASVNQILRKVKGAETQDFGLKYELCEIILCKASDKIRNIGFTVMDGPFFSIMPFGKTGYHSLTSVTLLLIRPAMMRHHSFPVWERMATAVREVFWGTVTIAPADRRAPGSICPHWHGNICGKSMRSAMRNLCFP